MRVPERTVSDPVVAAPVLSEARAEAWVLGGTARRDTAAFPDYSLRARAAHFLGEIATTTTGCKRAQSESRKKQKLERVRERERVCVYVCVCVV